MRFASGKQVNLTSGELKVNNALNHHWYEISLLPQAILKCVRPEISLSKLGTCDQFCWSYPDCLIGQHA